MRLGAKDSRVSEMWVQKTCRKRNLQNSKEFSMVGVGGERKRERMSEYEKCLCGYL